MFFALAGTAFIPENLGSFSRNLGLWARRPPLAASEFFIKDVFRLAAGSASVGVLLLRISKAMEPGERKELSIRVAFLSVSLALFYANEAALPLVWGMATPYCTPLVFSAWALGILYSRFAHGYTPAGAAEAPQVEIAALPDYSLLVDGEGMILEADEGAQAMLRRSAEELKGQPLGSLLSQPETVLREIRKMAATKAAQSSCQVAWLGQPGKSSHGRSRISAVHNSFGRASGYLITPFALGEIKALKDEYSLTDREIEVIHFAAQGLPNHTIARELSITERTVKAHLTNIYNKMGIDGKFKLMSRLKDFDV